MTESITVQQADIHTAAVEVAIMRISGKQVTLSVFRQLKEEPVIDPDGHFIGLPWGTVNYHPPKECNGADGNHLHVVWQKGNDLRRGTVRRPTHAIAWAEAGADWLVAASAAGWRPGLHWYERPYGSSTTIRISDEAGVFEVDPTSDLVNFWRWELLALDGRWAGRSNPPLHPTPGISAEQLLAEVRQEVGRWYEAQTQRDKRWAELHDLPQLFIAV